MDYTLTFDVWHFPETQMCLSVLQKGARQFGDFFLAKKKSKLASGSLLGDHITWVKKSKQHLAPCWGTE